MRVKALLPTCCYLILICPMHAWELFPPWSFRHMPDPKNSWQAHVHYMDFIHCELALSISFMCPSTCIQCKVSALVLAAFLYVKQPNDRYSRLSPPKNLQTEANHFCWIFVCYPASNSTLVEPEKDYGKSKVSPVHSSHQAALTLHS